jgi:hypothetical protein
MKRILNTTLRMCVLVAATSGAAALAQDLALDWWTIDGGGDMWTVGGSLELSGTIGQPDTNGTLTMTGSTLSLTGGFWAALGGGEAPQSCIGDLNCDGTIDFGDINPFVLYLSNNGVWATTYDGCNALNGDINCDGTYGQGSFGDINSFVSLITQCGSGCACPGPVSCP